MTTLTISAMTTLAVLAAEPAGGHEAVGAMPTVKQGLATGITALVVFALVAAFLLTFVWPKINKALEDRENKIRDEIESAERARKQAKDALDQYEKALASARAEAQAMLEKTRAEQRVLADELKATADAELGGMRERARRDIESAKKAAIQEIYSETANLATSIAGRVLQRELSVNDQRRLIDESMGQMQSVAGAR